MIHIQDDLWFMDLAIKQAELAYKEKEVPVGAVLVSANGEVLTQKHNLKESHHNPTAHAEVLSIIEAAKKLSSWRLTGATLYVTLEPCPMCLAAMVQARIKRCVFGAYDIKGGALSLGYHMHKDTRLNHRFSVTGGIRHFECSKILSEFFKERRSTYREKN
ncbi:MAG TPA: tRNA adenosine(34) deaminase TadA [Bacteriovoracaceae bacterium]|nr:tRNA adenosine(34) deaminase TadA [Bacteriovoracaceae bacterium]